MPRLTATLILLVALAAARATAAEVVFRDSFEAGAAKWQPYHAKPPQCTFAVATGNAADGEKFLRVKCPGKVRLEGVRVAIPGIEPFTLYTVRAKVRGHGELWGCLLSANGWLYSKQTLALTSQWQDLAMPKLTGPRDKSMAVYFMTRAKETATFEIDAVEVVKEPAPPAADTDVGTVRLEAEDYAAHAQYVQKDPEALGGHALKSSIYLGPANLPFPLTSRRVFTYVRLRPGTPEDTYRVAARIRGYLHTLATAKPLRPAGWQWVRMDVARPAAARGSVDIRVGQAKRGLPPAMIDAIVFSAKRDLAPEQLAAAPLLGRDRPLTTAGRCTTPPTIDGRADDDCWADAIAVRDFTLTGRDAPPSQPTVAKLCYDDQRLYVAFRCKEYVLQTEANQLHAFKQAQTKRDSDVWKDDCVLLIVAPKADGPHFDVFANARGTLADARCELPDIWRTRDKSWNGDIAAAGRVDNGYWEVELGIAFASLGVTAPKPGDRWRLCLGRIEKNAKEVSAWNPVVSGFHVAGTLGTLQFLPQAGGLDMTAPAKFAGGRNVVKLERSAHAPAALVQTTLEQRPAAPTHTGTVLAPDAKADAAFDVPATGQATLLFDAFDGGTLAPLYLSPRLMRSVKASDAKLRLATSGPYAVFLNRERVAAGASADGSQVVRVPLQAGANAFSFQVEDGKLAATIEAPGQCVVSNAAWRWSPGEPKTFAAAAFDDSKWPHARVFGKAAGALGNAGAQVIGGKGRGVLRRIIWFEHTYLWPTPEPAQYVPANAAQHLTFSATGMRGRKLNDFKFHLAVPPDFEVIGATGYYGRSRGPKAEFIMSGPTRAKRRGHDALVYTVSANKPLPYRPKVRILELFNVFVRYRGPAEPAKEYTFDYWTEAERGSVTECPQTFPVRVTPALRGKQPKRLLTQIWGSFFSAMDDPKMKDALLATCAAAGFNNMVSGCREDSELCAKHGMTNTMGINFAPWCLSRVGYLEAHPDHALVDAAGKRSKKFVCTTMLLGPGWADVARQLRERIAERKPHIVDWDFESSPFTGYLTCYCPRCLAEFRKRAGLAPDLPLDAATIRDSYAKQWIDFMTTRQADIAAKFRKVVNDSGAAFSIYSGYESDDTHRRYGVDWRKIGDQQAADHVGCGYGRRREPVDATVAALKGIPLVTGALMHPYDRALRERVLPMTKAKMMRRLADSTGGVLVYDRMPLGGRSWFAIAEVFRLAAEHEDVFLSGKPAPELAQVAGAAEGDLSIKRAGNVALVLLMNHSRKAKTFRVKLDADAVQAASLYYAQKALSAAAPIEVKLEPGDAEAVVLRPR